ncbi:MAG: NAD/NADP octopine/nopaline dehydrogenase family protein [Oscillospiraceae bacterium]|jgi:opine dehydrogenase
MLDKRKIAVISTGNGGQSMAAYFSHLGYRVALYAREAERVKMFKNNHFVIDGILQAETDIELISCDMEEIIRDAHLIMVTTPSQYHHIIAREIAPHLEEGQIVVLNPGRTLGTFVFDKVLRETGGDEAAEKVILAETDTFAFTCRCVAVGRPMIFFIKTDVIAAAHRPEDNQKVRDALHPIFSDIRMAPNVLHTSMCNIGMVFHPLPILLNITRVEAKENFLFYMEGISPLVANILEKIDDERVNVAAALGIKTPNAIEWLWERYGSTGANLYTAIQNTHAYSQIMAPTDIDTRYIFEDVLTGLVPMSCLGKNLGVPTPIIDSAINWASTVYHLDFFSLGRNEENIDFEAVLKAAGK